MKILHKISTFLVLLVGGLALTGCLKLEPDADEGENPNEGCECINPETGEPDVLVNCFADPCPVNSCEGDPEATCEANYCGGCHAIYTDTDGEPAVCEPIACTKDARVCPDGTVVSRDPLNNCEFFPCPES